MSREFGFRVWVSYKARLKLMMGRYVVRQLRYAGSLNCFRFLRMICVYIPALTRLSCLESHGQTESGFCGAGCRQAAY